MLIIVWMNGDEFKMLLEIVALILCGSLLVALIIDAINTFIIK